MKLKALDPVQDWSCAKSFLPFDLDAFAVSCGALQRRRGVEGGEGLLRSLLLCGLPGSTFEHASKMALDLNLGVMNKTALFKRFCNSEQFLKGLFEHSLRHACGQEKWAGYRLLALDCTILCGPAAKGIDQRLHVVYDLGSAMPIKVDVTGQKVGESFKHHDCFVKGDLVLADRAYGHASGMKRLDKTGVKVLVRANLHMCRLYDAEGNQVTEEQATPGPNSEPAEFEVFAKGYDIPFRLIAQRNPKDGVGWLLTNLSQEELPAHQSWELYSRRWQIELFFKRLKSLLDLDALPTRDGPSVRSWIWTKLLLASLAVILSHERFSPWAQALDEEPLEAVLAGIAQAYDSDSYRCRTQAATWTTEREQAPKTTLSRNPVAA